MARTVYYVVTADGDWKVTLEGGTLRAGTGRRRRMEAIGWAPRDARGAGRVAGRALARLLERPDRARRPNPTMLG